MTQITDLRCEYGPSPLGIHELRPRLSWKLLSDRRGAGQAAYRILVSREVAGADLWDSGWVESPDSVFVPYGGTPLASGERAWWTVRVRDDAGDEVVSRAAFWEMGLLSREEWGADWIGGPLVGAPRQAVPAPFLRRGFGLDRPVASARLYLTALGVYEAWINGERVGDEWLMPGWTDYAKRVHYRTYDVTALLRDGENALGAILGDGWYSGHIEWRPRQRYGDRPRLLARLAIRHDDGAETAVVSDGSWKVAYGPILEHDLLMGEDYDARREFPGWSAPGFGDSAWTPASIFEAPDIQVVPHPGPPIRMTEEILPIAEPHAVATSRWQHDPRQTTVGGPRQRPRGTAAQTAKLRHAEVQKPDGTIYTENLRSAKQTNYYTLATDGEEVFEPRFTFHGFRYLEVSGVSGKPEREDVTGVVFHSDCPRTGAFECSDPLINQLVANVDWGWRGNSVDVPTDCPQRDERMGWTGDAQVFVRTSTYFRDVAGFWAKWERDVADAQNAEGDVPPVCPNPAGAVGQDGGPAWADAAVICPWTIYLAYGDRGILERAYPTMTRYVDSLEKSTKDGIRSYDGMPGFAGFGDWLAHNAETPIDLIGTAFLAYSSGLLARIAEILGKPEDAANFGARRDVAVEAFNRRFVTRDGLVGSGSQTSYVLALHFDLLPEELRPRALEALVRNIERRGNKLSTGFVGTPYLPHVLTRFGRADVAYRLLNQKDWPSWLYPVTQGATTIWERWDGWTHDKGFQDVGMNSFNHYAYGAVGDWLFSTVAGIDLDPERPGYEHILLRPQPGGGLTWAKASYDSIRGRIESGWRIEGEDLTYEVLVPANTTATVRVPLGEGEAAKADGAWALRDEEGVTVFEVPSGRYRFTVRGFAPGTALVPSA